MADRLAPLRAAVDAALDRFLAADREIPPLILEAARYAVLGPGKRLRPILVLASGEATAGRPEELMPAACAVEMIHAFSLVHDDLPALDDDSLRRGRPTVHVRFDEATAILAGDALLNLAFEVLATAPAASGGEARRLRALAAVARAVGLRGMIGGQVLDLEFEGKSATREELERIHRLKTGCLITASCVAGGILSGADEGAIGALDRYGRALGLAFQITDDILDVTGSAEEIGKSPGKDAAAAKTTFPSLFGLEASRRMAAEQVEAAVAAVSLFGERAATLSGIARSIASRRS
ncbi:MAG: polyprenyl synthetase family protein [Acidobacteria bacterium]|nr:polyprenyl synthetase family protein [Acidobacteriota bacterium]